MQGVGDRRRCLPDAGRRRRFGDVQIALPPACAGYLAERVSPGERAQTAGAPAILVSRRTWPLAQPSPGGNGARHSRHGTVPGERGPERVDPQQSSARMTGRFTSQETGSYTFGLVI